MHICTRSKLASLCFQIPLGRGSSVITIGVVDAATESDVLESYILFIRELVSDRYSRVGKWESRSKLVSDELTYIKSNAPEPKLSFSQQP